MDTRRVELERAILARVSDLPDTGAGGEHPRALRRAVSAGVSHCLAGVEHGEASAPAVPGLLFAQAREAARSGVTPDAMLRRCFAGYVTFSDFIVRAAADGPSPGSLALGRVLNGQAVVFAQLAVAVMGEYTRERERWHSPRSQRQFERVRKLLAAEPVDVAELAYDFDDWHIGAVARGGGATSALRDLAREADRRLLLVRPDTETVWGWLGGRRRTSIAEIARQASLGEREEAFVTLGEPARGIQGWRLTHEQAMAAFRNSSRGAKGVVLYADVGLVASVARDHVLARSLRQLYIAPLTGGRDGGAALRDTLRAYLAAARNISSAASALGVSRQTVSSRLRMIEEKLGRTLESCAPELEIALRLEDSGRDLSNP